MSSRPRRLTLPRTRAFEGSRPKIAIEETLLPEPDSPTIASTSPGSTEYVTWRAAGTHTLSTPKSTLRSVTSSTGPLGVTDGFCVALMRTHLQLYGDASMRG